MKKLLLFLAIILSLSAFSSEETLVETMTPKRYKKRSEPIINVSLMYYGDYYTLEDLDRIEALLVKRFHFATGTSMKMNVISKSIIPFGHKIQDYPTYTQPHVTDSERLQRLWYYDHFGGKVIEEIWNTVRKDELQSSHLKNADMVLIVTGAQFDALGFANGRIGITENPMEIAWGLPDGGRVEFVSDAKVVDELLHELGHTMFLDHSGSQCQKPGLTPKEKIECCENSPSKNDVMSYCRQRALVNEDFFYGYGECTQRVIRKQVIPALLKGKKWKLSNRETCL